MFAELQSRYRCETSFLSCHRRLHDGGVRAAIQFVCGDPTAVIKILAQSARGDPRRSVGDNVGALGSFKGGYNKRTRPLTRRRQTHNKWEGKGRQVISHLI